MSEVVSLEEQKLKNVAKDYAAVYTEEGEVAAGAFLLGALPKEKHKDIAPYVRVEMEHLGWEF